MVILTEEEQKVLDAKIEKPQAILQCPRCGNVIEYLKIGNSIRVNCVTPGCIKKTLRGI